MSESSALLMVSIGTLLVLFWVFLYIRYRNSFDQLLLAVDKDLFFLPELFFVGFGVINLFRINIRTERGRKKEKKIAEVYGAKYAEFYHYCIVGGQITYALTIAPLGFFFGAISGDMLYALLVIGGAIALVVYLDADINASVEKKREEVLSDFPEVLSKLTLLVNAGMVVREAWTRVAYTGNRALYREMQITSEEMGNGTSDLDAFYNFSQRCALKEIKKFASVLSQNIQKGSAELAMNLRYMCEESWEEKKHRVKRKGEVASTKLMLPVMIMFLGILLIIVVPIVTNIL